MNTPQTAEGGRRKAEGRKPSCLLLTAYCLLFTTGCIRRNLTIRSEPPGAQLFLNDKRVGFTPYSEGFLWYGWYRVSMVKPGYERLDDRVLIKAPVYFWIPFDLAMELLPFKIRDRREFSYRLVAKPPRAEPTPPPLSSQKTGSSSEATSVPSGRETGEGATPSPVESGSQPSATTPSEDSHDHAR